MNRQDQKALLAEITPVLKYHTNLLEKFVDDDSKHHINPTLREALDSINQIKSLLNVFQLEHFPKSIVQDEEQDNASLYGS